MDGNPQGTRKRTSLDLELCVMQKHLKKPDGDKHEFVRNQNSSSRPTEVEDKSGRPITPMRHRGLDDDNDETL